MKQSKLFFLSALTYLVILSGSASGQSLSFNARFEFEQTSITVEPMIRDVNIVLSDEARKNHVEGVAKVALIFGKDGKVRNVNIVQDLPFGVGAALVRAISELRFTPAVNGNEPIDIKATLVCNIYAVYSPFDRNITKVNLLDKPVAEYPAPFRAERAKGKVTVVAIFFPDGKIQAGSAQSTMPAEFDEAAKKAVANLKFQPAVHKKTKKPVVQLMLVVFEFKP